MPTMDHGPGIKSGKSSGSGTRRRATKQGGTRAQMAAAGRKRGGRPDSRAPVLGVRLASALQLGVRSPPCAAGWRLTSLQAFTQFARSGVG